MTEVPPATDSWSSDHTTSPQHHSPLLRTMALYVPFWLPMTGVLTLAILFYGTVALQNHIFGLAIREIEQGAQHPDWQPQVLWWWAGGIFALAFFRGIAGYAQGVWAVVIGQRLIHDLRQRLFTHLLALSAPFYRDHGAGELITRSTRDADAVRNAVILGARQLLDAGLVIISGITFLFIYDWALGLVPAVAVIGASYWLYRQGDRLVTLNRAAADRYDGLNEHLNEGVTGIRVVQSFVLEQHQVTGYRQRLAVFIAASRRLLRFSAIHLPMPQVLVALGHAWVFAWGLYLVASNQLPVGLLVAALMTMTGLVFRLDSINRSLQLFAEARASAARIWQVLDQPLDLHSGDNQLPPSPLSLDFRHIGVDDILDQCSLTISRGKITALVGATASGKSTLCSLAARHRDPDAGTIMMMGGDGSEAPLPSLDLACLRREVQVVFQQSFLLSASVRDNLILSAPEADEAACWQALEAAAAADFVRDLPDGLETMIGERGVTLSGGQKQRLCLARALMAQPQVLVLDDATSALDALTEANVLAHLRQRQAAVLLIASRMASIQQADSVAVLDDGRIVDQGPHHTLVTTSARYRTLLCLDEVDDAA